MPGRFTVRGTFVLAVRNRLIVYGDIEDGTVSAGEELRAPLNGGFGIAVTIESLETVDGTETGSHVALVVSEDDALGYELIQGMNFTNETLIVQVPV